MTLKSKTNLNHLDVDAFRFQFTWLAVILASLILLSACRGSEPGPITGVSDTETMITPAKGIQGVVTNESSIGEAGWTVFAIQVNHVPFEVSRDSNTVLEIEQVMTRDSGFFDFAELDSNALYNILAVDSLGESAAWFDSVKVGSSVGLVLEDSRSINIQKEIAQYPSDGSRLFLYFENSPQVYFCDGESTDILYIPQSWGKVSYYREDELIDSIPLSSESINQTFYINPADEWTEL